MDVISSSSSCRYISPMWTPGIIMIFLILQETEALRGQETSSKLHGGRVGTQTPVLYLYVCTVN